MQVTMYEQNAHDLLEQFVLEHRPLVKKIALFLKRRLPSYIELDDLIQSGLIGLLDAKQHYNANLGASFETYASIRIRGSILDSLRKNSLVSRDTMKTMKKVSEAITKIEQRDQRHATSDEIAKELGIPLEEYFQLAQEINLLHVASLTDVDQTDSILASDQEDPESIAQREGIKAELKSVLAKLPEREQLVLSLYYVEELTFKEIGEVLELTEARICQLHSQAITRIRGKMALEKTLMD